MTEQKPTDAAQPQVIVRGQVWERFMILEPTPIGAYLMITGSEKYPPAPRTKRRKGMRQ